MTRIPQRRLNVICTGWCVFNIVLFLILCYFGSPR